MTNDDRITSLEKNLAHLQDAFVQSIHLSQRLGGQARMFESAVLALVVAHPDPRQLEQSLKEHLARTDASIVNEALSEDHFDGAMKAKKVIEFALAAAIERTSAVDARD